MASYQLTKSVLNINNSSSSFVVNKLMGGDQKLLGVTPNFSRLIVVDSRVRLVAWLKGVIVI
jgi:hypothetical protein